MASFWEYLTGATKQRDPRLNMGYSEASDALADFQAASQGYSPPTGLTGPLRLGMDAVYGVSQIPDLYKMLTGTGVGAVQSTSEGFPFYQSEESSDRMGRELMALTNEAPVDLFVAPYAGALSKVGEFAEMGKKSLPYLLGQKLDDAPDTANLRPQGIPAGVTIPNEGRFSARPIAEIQRITENYIKEAGLDGAEYLVYPELDAERAKLIAAAYQRMKNDPENEEVAASYQALIDETMAQYNALKDAGIDFKFLKEGQPDPYAESPAAGYKDMIENKRLYVFPTDQGFGSNDAVDVSKNPMLTPVGTVGDKEDAVANDAFRIVHDVFGHLGAGNPQFRAAGEERAFLEHSRMYSPLARKAMASETRGQNSTVNSGMYADLNEGASGADTIYADQKIGLMPDWAIDPEGMPDPVDRLELEEIIRNWPR
jgi:hypothetical protein